LYFPPTMSSTPDSTQQSRLVSELTRFFTSRGWVVEDASELVKDVGQTPVSFILRGGNGTKTKSALVQCLENAWISSHLAPPPPSMGGSSFASAASGPINNSTAYQLAALSDLQKQPDRSRHLVVIRRLVGVNDAAWRILDYAHQLTQQRALVRSGCSSTVALDSKGGVTDWVHDLYLLYRDEYTLVPVAQTMERGIHVFLQRMWLRCTKAGETECPVCARRLVDLAPACVTCETNLCSHCLGRLRDAAVLADKQFIVCPVCRAKTPFVTRQASAATATHVDRHSLAPEAADSKEGAAEEIRARQEMEEFFTQSLNPATAARMAQEAMRQEACQGLVDLPYFPFRFVEGPAGSATLAVLTEKDVQQYLNRWLHVYLDREWDGDASRLAVMDWAHLSKDWLCEVNRIRQAKIGHIRVVVVAQ